jgi:hypothetical protein
MWLVVTAGVCDSACGASGDGNGGGGANHTGTTSGAYLGTWSGQTTNTACSDTVGLTAAKYCSRLSGAVEAVTFSIVQSGTSSTLCINVGTPGARAFGSTNGGCATSAGGQTIAKVHVRHRRRERGDRVVAHECDANVHHAVVLHQQLSRP